MQTFEQKELVIALLGCGVDLVEFTTAEALTCEEAPTPDT